MRFKTGDIVRIIGNTGYSFNKKLVRITNIVGEIVYHDGHSRYGVRGNSYKSAFELDSNVGEKSDIVQR